MSKYEYIIELGKELPGLSDEEKIPEYKIPGCQSNVWIIPSVDDETGMMRFRADSDALITKGLVALLLSVFDDQQAEQVANADVEFLEVIGMSEHLSSTRKNGLSQMLKRIKMFASSSAGLPAQASSETVTVDRDAVEAAIRTVYDPEIPVNVYDLGLIYEVIINPDNTVFVQMTLTTPNCPAAAYLPNQVEQAVRGLEGVNDARVEITFEPPYTIEMMSEAAKLELGLL